ncbi:MAG: hypothetical protein EHM35_18615 [Planctomycetaceae bacterium]|nr:MAG: hypothetical protein EHM35_18615 [Planctomycetaceae bacterium]
MSCFTILLLLLLLLNESWGTGPPNPEEEGMPVNIHLDAIADAPGETELEQDEAMLHFQNMPAPPIPTVPWAQLIDAGDDGWIEIALNAYKTPEGVWMVSSPDRTTSLIRVKVGPHAVRTSCSEAIPGISNCFEIVPAVADE